MPKSIKSIKGSFHLPIETAILVPSTTAKSKKISAKEFQARINLTRRFLSRLFGGYTSVSGIGGYLLKGKVIREKVAIVSSFCKLNSFKKYKREWVAWIRTKKKEWKQDSIGVIIENDLFYV